MKSEATLPTSTPVRILDPEEELAAKSGSRLLASLERSKQMNFTILGEQFDFTLTTDAEGHLTSFTATRDSVNYTCKIQLESETNERECCGPSGCAGGSC